MAERDDRADPSEVAAALRAVVDGVSAAPDTTADPLHLAYLAGYADALDHVAGDADPGPEQGDCELSP